MRLEFGYDNSVQTVDVPEKNVIKVLMSNDMVHERRGAEAVRYALENPVGSSKLCELAKPGKKAVIVTSDISRPLPSYDILPSVLDELNKGGIPDRDITVVFALGSHRSHTEEEKKHLAGDEAYERVRCEDSCDTGFVHMGDTSSGTPVDICRRVAEADLRVCLGNVEFHYFAGYSGGYKAIMPGCSTVEAIQKNHTKMTCGDAHAGKLSGNPVREDIEEAGRICGVDFIVNAVLSEHKEIVYAAAGDVIKAHRDACEYLDKMYRCRIPEKADIVIVSQGGAPKDANLYQVQKALDNSGHAVKDGGTIILAGCCREGFGSKKFEEWLMEAESPHSMIERIGKHFELGGHKAAAVGMVLEKADIYLVSEMPDDIVRRIFMTPFQTVEEAYKAAAAKYGPDATVIAMPFGGATLPCPDEAFCDAGSAIC